MKIFGKTNKKKIAQLLLLCLQYGTPKGEEYTLKQLQIKSKFQGINDFRKMRSCIDLIEDTEDAIINFFEYQLATRRNRVNQGEVYLRLYGIVNAIYLQKQAIIEIMELVKFADKKNYQRQLEALKIFEVRNIVGSHMVNFKTDKTTVYKTRSQTLNFFFITQCELKPDGTNLTIVDGHSNYEELNLKRLVIEYALESEVALAKTLEKYLSTLCKNDMKTKNELMQPLSSIIKRSTNYLKFDKLKDYNKKRIQKLLDDAEGLKLRIKSREL